ncbi:MAG: peptidoglycan DD-metalloendopeptidase family protein [Anaerolineae bacterium]|nr:peptidoglycan DD-metalloendopeptidase family protein [Anaerolineae bacterium]
MISTRYRWLSVPLTVLALFLGWALGVVASPEEPKYRYVFPVQPPDVAHFAPEHHDYPATDIFAPAGALFVAPTDGVIEFISREDLWNPEADDPVTRGGLAISMVGDDGVRYYGSHLSEVDGALAAGMRVQAGQTLGRIGQSGNARSTPSHLHFGISHPTFPDDWAVRRGEVSPYPYLQAWLKGEMRAPAILSRSCAASGAEAASNCEIFGYSAQGRPLEVYRFGNGPVKIALIGAIHGGYEWNSAALMHRLMAHLVANPTLVFTRTTLYVVPLLNPDGLARSGGPDGRFNGNMVDINRNWDCLWQPRAEWKGRAVSPGARPFSEPEAQALRDFLLDGRFRAAVFYHSSGGMVTAGARCGGGDASRAFSHAIARATGYTSMRFPQSDVTGEAADWFTSQGIPAVAIELSTHVSLDWAQNLKALQAIQQVAVANSPSQPPVQEVPLIPIPGLPYPLIWRWAEGL